MEGIIKLKTDEIKNKCDKYLKALDAAGYIEKEQ